jgi:hypothetical protein
MIRYAMHIQTQYAPLSHKDSLVINVFTISSVLVTVVVDLLSHQQIPILVRVKVSSVFNI